VADVAGAKLPSYVTREQAQAIINAAETKRDRLLLPNGAVGQAAGNPAEVAVVG